MIRNVILILLLIAPKTSALVIKSPKMMAQDCTRRDSFLFVAASCVTFGAPSSGKADTGMITMPPQDLGVVGLRKEGNPGRLSTCPPPQIRSCISTSDKEEDGVYVPPWTYQPEGGYGRAAVKKSDEVKTIDSAILDLRAVIEATPDARIVETKLDGRYVRIEFDLPAVAFPPAPKGIDDLEFLFSPPGSDPPGLVNYRSAARPGGIADKGSKRQRTRVKELRVKLQEKGWASVGRFIT